MKARFVRRLPLAALLVLLACSDSTSPNSPEQVDNRTDNFQFRINDISDLSGTFRYFWRNTGAMATVNRITAVTSGLGSIEITDDAGARVFSGQITETGTMDTDVGQPGDWTISVILVRVVGTLDFTVRKK